MKITSISLQMKSEGIVRMMEKQPDKQENISTDITYEKREKEIDEGANPQEKKEGFCFFSFC